MAHLRTCTTVTVLALVVSTVMPSAALDSPAWGFYFGGTSQARAEDASGYWNAFEEARARGMDFLAVIPPAPSPALASAAASMNSALPGQFVALWGWQYGPPFDSHVNVLETGNASAPPFHGYEMFFRSWLPHFAADRAHPPVVQFARPWGSTVDDGTLGMASPEAFTRAVSPYARTIELPTRSGSSASGGQRSGSLDWRPYLHYLNLGLRLAPAAAADFTDVVPSPDRTGQHRTVIVSTRLTREDLLDGIRQRRVYASEDRNLRIGFSIDGWPMGSIVPIRAGAPLRVEVTLADPDEPRAAYWVSVRRDSPDGPVEAAEELFGTDLVGDGRIVFTQFTRRHVAEYYLLHVVQRSGNGIDSAWTAPVWLMPTGPSASFEAADPIATW